MRWRAHRACRKYGELAVWPNMQRRGVKCVRVCSAVALDSMVVHFTLTRCRLWTCEESLYQSCMFTVSVWSLLPVVCFLCKVLSWRAIPRAWCRSMNSHPRVEAHFVEDVSHVLAVALACELNVWVLHVRACSSAHQPATGVHQRQSARRDSRSLTIMPALRAHENSAKHQPRKW